MMFSGAQPTAATQDIGLPLFSEIVYVLNNINPWSGKFGLMGSWTQDSGSSFQSARQLMRILVLKHLIQFVRILYLLVTISPFPGVDMLALLQKF